MKIKVLAALFSFFLGAMGLHAQLTLKVMQYNLLQYGASPSDCTPAPLTSKDVWLDAITNAYQPDIFTVNEMAPEVAYATRIKTKSLKYKTMSYGGLTNTKNSDLGNMIFYDPAKLGYKGVAIIDGVVRDINAYTLYEKVSAARGDTIFLICIVAHLKAGNTTADASTRQLGAQNVMNWIQQNAAGKNVLFMGDFNTYGSDEGAYQTAVFNANTSLQLRDPSGATSGWGDSQRKWLTQSPRTSSSNCGSAGGMDDRFDFILASQTIMDGTARINYVPGTYATFGNDGTVYDAALNCTNNPLVSTTVCNALREMSDHLPVVLTLNVDNTVAIDPAQELIPFTAWYNKETKQIQWKSEGSIFAEKGIIDILNIQGMNCISQPQENGTIAGAISVDQLPAGIYLVQAKSATAAYTLKVVVE